MAQENEKQGVEQAQKQPVKPQVVDKKKSKTPLIIVIAVFFIALAGLAGVFFLKDSIFPARGLSGQVLSTNCKLNDKDLCRFLNSFKGLDSMSAKSVTTINGKKTESTMEIQGNDKSHITSSVDGQEESNYIAIGNTTYMKDYTDNKWWKTTVDTKDTAETEKTDWKAEFEKSVNDSADKTTYKKIGKEACGKLTCLKYQVIDPNNKETTEYIWFDTKNYALRKVRSEAKDTVTETTFSYDKINIIAPSPTKEMTSPEDAYDSFLKSSAGSGAVTDGLTPEQIQEIQSSAGSFEDGASLPAE
jgi:hypothetical protein